MFLPKQSVMKICFLRLLALIEDIIFLNSIWKLLIALSPSWKYEIIIWQTQQIWNFFPSKTILKWLFKYLIVVSFSLALSNEIEN